jgi:hypothetical protein
MAKKVDIRYKLERHPNTEMVTLHSNVLFNTESAYFHGFGSDEPVPENLSMFNSILGCRISSINKHELSFKRLETYEWDELEDILFLTFRKFVGMRKKINKMPTLRSDLIAAANYRNRDPFFDDMY